MTTDFSLMDIMGNYTGFPVAPDTTSDTATTATTQVSETPAASKTYINPRLALKTQPVAPTEGGTTYDRMLQAESGNRDFDAQGRPITSPKGAMFAGQVMPTTAASPGFGIKPAASQTPEEYNRVGQEYYQAMLKKFGGNEQAAIAAYNAGPGRIQQNLAANQGQLNVAQLPRETQGYLGKVLKGVGNVVEGMIPSAQAGTLPPQPAAAPAVAPAAPQTETAINPETGETYQRLVSPAAPAVAPVSPQQAAAVQTTAAPTVPSAEGYTGQGLKIGGQTAESLRQQQDYNTVLNSNSAEQLNKMAFALDTPKDVQRAAFDKLQNTMAVEEGMRRAKAVADKLGANPTPQALNRAMNDKDTGSYFKVLMYQALGWVSKAKEELDKIDPKAVYGQTSLDGVNYRTKINPNTNEILAAWDSTGTLQDQSIINRIGAEGYNAKTMGNLKEVVKVGDKTIGVYQDGSMIDLGTKQRYTGSLASAEKLTGSATHAGATRVRDADNVEWSVVPTEKGSVFYDNAGNKGVPKGKTVPIQGGTDIELQAQLLRERSKAKLNDLISSLTAKNIAEPTIAANKLIAEFNQKNDTNIQPSDIDWSKLKTPGSAPAAAAAPAPGSALAGPVSPAAAPAAAPAAGQVPAAGAPSAGEPTAPSQYSKLPPAPRYRERGFENESPETFNDRREAWSKTYGKMYESQQKNTKQAQSIFPDVTKMKTLIDQGTSSGIGAMIDQAGNFVGYSTKGAEAIAAIAPLASKILMSVERFEGPQSDKDVASYKEAAGKLADPTIPAAQKQAAFNTIIDIMRRNAPELDWDTALGIKKPAAGGPTPGTRKTIPGRGEFVFDGKGWKPV